MAFNLNFIGKKLHDYEGAVGNFFGGAAKGLGDVANQTGRVVGGTALGIGKGLVDTTVNAGRTVADLPVQASKSIYHLAQGDIQGAANAQRNSYLNQQYGSKFAGDTSGLGNAASFGLDFAGLKGGGSLISQGVKSSLPKVAIRGAAGGAGLGAGYGVAQSAQQNNLSLPNVSRNVGIGALTGGIAGGALPVISHAVAPVVRQIVPTLRNEGGYIGQPRIQGKYSNTASDYVDHANPQDVFSRAVDIKQQIQGRPGGVGLEAQWKVEKQLADNPSLSAHERMKRNAALENSDMTRQLRDLYAEHEQLQGVLNKHFPAQGQPVKLSPKAILSDQSGFLGLPSLGKKPQVKLAKSEQPPQTPENILYASTENGPQPLLPKSVARPVSLADKAFRSTRSIIERQGEPGRQLAQMLRSSRDTEEIYLAQLQKSTPTVHSLKGKDFENFVDSVEGNAQPTSPKIAQAVSEWKTTAPAIREQALKIGLDVGDLGQNYYPHFIDFDKLFKDHSSYNEAVNHLVSTGQAKDTAEAIKALGFARDVSRNRKFGNLEASRLVNLPMYDKSPDSLRKYLQGSVRRMSQAHHFGLKDEKALDLISQAGEKGFDAEAMKNAYDIAVGAKKYNPETAKLSANLRKYQSTTRLGLGALTNTSQSVNTGIVTGHLRTMGAMLKQLNPKVRDYVADTGVISDAVLNDLREQSGFVGKGLSKVTAPGFQKVETFNRSVAATAGRDYALRLAQKGDEKTLRRLGVTGPIEGRSLTYPQQIQASRMIVEKTQFKVDPQDLPGWASSPGGKLVSQFRTFSYSQGKFFSNEILKPARTGNYVPLARLLAALPLGYALYEAKRNIAGRPEEKSEPRVALESFSNVGGAGLALDLFRGVNPLNGKYLDPSRRVSMAVGTVGGPTVGLATDLIGGISEATQRKSVPDKGLEGKIAVGSNGSEYTDVTPLARTALKQIPIVGTPLQNRVLPYGGTNPAISLFPTASAAGAEPVAPVKGGASGGSVLTGATDTPEAKAAAKLKRDTNKAGVEAGTRLGGTKELNAAQSRIDTAVAKFPEKLSDSSKKIITRYAKLNSDGKDKFNADPKNTLNLKLAQYEEKKLDGKMTKLEDYKARQAITKLKITSKFSNDVTELYGLSKAALKDYFDANPDQQGLFSDVTKLDRALVAAGIQDKSKFQYGLGSKPRKGSVAVNAPKTFSVGSFAKPTVSIKKVSRPTARKSVSRKGINAAVTIRKSKV